MGADNGATRACDARRHSCWPLPALPQPARRGPKTRFPTRFGFFSGSSSRRPGPWKRRCVRHRPARAAARRGGASQTGRSGGRRPSLRAHAAAAAGRCRRADARLRAVNHHRGRTAGASDTAGCRRAIASTTGGTLHLRRHARPPRRRGEGAGAGAGRRLRHPGAGLGQRARRRRHFADHRRADQLRLRRCARHLDRRHGAADRASTRCTPR